MFEKFSWRNSLASLLCGWTMCFSEVFRITNGQVCYNALVSILHCWTNLYLGSKAVCLRGALFNQQNNSSPYVAHFFRSSHWRYSVKTVFSKISQNSQENTCARISYLIKLQASACSCTKKETLTQVFSSKFCEIFKDAFLTEHIRWLLLFLSIFLFISALSSAL